MGSDVPCSLLSCKLILDAEGDLVLHTRNFTSTVWDRDDAVGELDTGRESVLQYRHRVLSVDAIGVREWSTPAEKRPTT